MGGWILQSVLNFFFTNKEIEEKGSTKVASNVTFDVTFCHIPDADIGFGDPSRPRPLALICMHG